MPVVRLILPSIELGKSTRTYVLLGLVLVIWGIVGYRIFSTLAPETQEKSLVATTTFTDVQVAAQDTFSIQANYRDPFLGTLPPSQRKFPKTKKGTRKKINFPSIAYTGSMVNSSTKKRIFFVTVNGTQHLLEKGKTGSEVTLMHGTGKSITIRYKGAVKRVMLQK